MLNADVPFERILPTNFPDIAPVWDAFYASVLRSEITEAGFVLVPIFIKASGSAAITAALPAPTNCAAVPVIPAAEKSIVLAEVLSRRV